MLALVVALVIVVIIISILFQSFLCNYGVHEPNHIKVAFRTIQSEFTTDSMKMEI